MVLVNIEAGQVVLWVFWLWLLQTIHFITDDVIWIQVRCVWCNPQGWKICKLEPEQQVPKQVLLIRNLGEGWHVQLLNRLVLLVDAKDHLHFTSQIPRMYNIHTRNFKGSRWATNFHLNLCGDIVVMLTLSAPEIFKDRFHTGWFVATLLAPHVIYFKLNVGINVLYIWHCVFWINTFVFLENRTTTSKLLFLSLF